MKKIAVIGATGLLGRQLLSIMDEKWNMDEIQIVPVCSRKSAGRELSVGDKTVKTVLLEDFIKTSSDNVDMIFLTAAEPVIEKWHKGIAQKSNKIINLSGYSSLKDEGVFSAVLGGNVLVLERLVQSLKTLSPIGQISSTILESASCHGKGAMDELFTQAKNSFVHQELVTQHYQKRIAFNLLPSHGGTLSDGQTKDEWKMRAEFQKIFGRDIGLSLTLVQVPVFIGNSFSLTIDFENEVLADQVRDLFRETSGVVVMDNKQDENHITPVEIAGDEMVVVSRIREDASHDTAIQLWVCADTMRLQCLKALSLAEA